MPVDPSADARSSRLQVDAGSAGLRADAYIARELPGLSRTRLRQKIQMGEALLNGRRFATSTRLREGDQIVVTLRSQVGGFGAVARAELPVLFEDEHLLAVDKPAGMATHPMGRTQSGTVIQLALDRYASEIRESLGRGDRDRYPRLVNRLDVFTSGIVLVARTREAQREMQVVTAERRVRKEYLAIVEGVVACGSGTILLPVGPDPRGEVRVKMAVFPGGRPSVTSFRVLRRSQECTLLLVTPETGRQHQIRVHLAAIGHPVAGDLLYKDERLFLRYQANGGAVDQSLPPRHGLHASFFWFKHPVTGEAVTIESPPPWDFLSMMPAAAP